MKKLLFAIIILATQLTSYAQKPKWVDYSTRNNLYPEKFYFVGFNSDVLAANQTSDDLLNKLSSYARVQLIESIQVTIKSMTEMKLENINTKTSEHFKQTSTSFSKANVVGLKYETFFDTKEKMGYAIAYVKKSDVVTYYQNVIATKKGEVAKNINQGKQFLTANDKSNALKSYYECMPIFREIEEAQTLLITVGVTNETSLAIDEVNAYQTEVKKALASLQSSKSLTLDEVAYFLAFGLQIQIDKLSQPVSLGTFTYQATDMSSAFSRQFGKTFEQNLIKTAGYSVKQLTHETKADATTNPITLNGTYWKDGDNLKIIAIMRNTETGSAMASAEGYLPISALTNINLNYVPENLAKVQMLNKIILKVKNTDIVIKATQLSKTPIEVYAYTKDENGIERPAANIPVKYKFMKSNTKIHTSNTDASGLAKCFVFAKPKDKISMIKAEVDVAQYLNIDSTSTFYKELLSNNSVPDVQISMRVLSMTIAIETTENNLGSRMDIPILEPKMKDALGLNGFEFVQDVQSADYIIKIAANTRRGTNFQGMCFSFLDANVTIVERATGNETYKNAFTNLKGSGADHSLAGMKAYNSSAKKIIDEIVTQFKK
jgi:hypothetical protein